ncbi:hypothetical protein BpHYR1_009596 [Brachionus plicatilis]|uniref:Uncharacterized protein n=1 Tax=Brachionus plicatilis TaxID=10195 RepID=A0A3M7T5W4_BRAPC|nr:hypothetical protein BpHYR1_009596 [Brachionus plicatilis]
MARAPPEQLFDLYCLLSHLREDAFALSLDSSWLLFKLLALCASSSSQFITILMLGSAERWAPGAACHSSCVELACLRSSWFLILASWSARSSSPTTPARPSRAVRSIEPQERRCAQEKLAVSGSSLILAWTKEALDILAE